TYSLISGTQNVTTGAFLAYDYYGPNYFLYDVKYTPPAGRVGIQKAVCLNWGGIAGTAPNEQDIFAKFAANSCLRTLVGEVPYGNYSAVLLKVFGRALSDPRKKL